MKPETTAFRKLIICKGLSGSGKSTWAEQQALSSAMSAEDFIQHKIVVNKDRIRRNLELQGWTWSKEREADVIKERDMLISYYLGNGNTVISDDTNLAPKHETRLRELAKQFGAPVEIKDFRDVPIATCIERDSKREGKARVGAKVILDMARQFGLGTTSAETPTFAPYVPNETLPRAVLCDLDGTLADTGGRRSIYDFSTCDQDDVKPATQAAVIAFLNLGIKVVFVTGREEKFREQTKAFLKKAGKLDYLPLFMRATDDFRKDWVIKGEIFDREIRPKYNVLLCLDDRDQVVSFYRSLGLTVFQVAPGAF